MSKYYSFDKILKMKDLNKKEPAIYLISTNRSGGKTTGACKNALEDFKKDGSQFILLFRYSYELSGSNLIFEDVLRLYSDLGHEMITKPHSKGLFYELILDGETCGYSISMSNPDSLKKYSPVFANVNTIIMDEFQKEDGKYLSNEPRRLQSIYLTVARGGGEQSRHVKVFLLGNMITIMNPYFIYFGIHKRLKPDTKFMRGNGWVAEFGFIKSASDSIKNNSFFDAFENDDYMSCSTEKVYMIDSKVFIKKPSGRAKYICTIIYDKKAYGVRDYFDEGIVYISNKPDRDCKQVITFKASDHTQNTIMLSHFSYTWKFIKDSFQNGTLRFDDEKTKSCIFDIIGVDLYK